MEVIGGTAPYTYAWNNNLPSIEDHNNIEAGMYSVTVTDANNCFVQSDAIILEPQEITIFTTLTDVTCSGENDGVVNAIASGGAAPYTYQWSNGQIGEVATNLPAGIFDLTITDANNCSVVNSINMMEADPISALYTISNPSCPGDQNASIDLSISGGGGDYNFEWSNGIQSEDQNNLSPGVYSVSVSDQNGMHFSF